MAAHIQSGDLFFHREQLGVREFRLVRERRLSLHARLGRIEKAELSRQIAPIILLELAEEDVHR